VLIKHAMRKCSTRNVSITFKPHNYAKATIQATFLPRCTYWKHAFQSEGQLIKVPSLLKCNPHHMHPRPAANEVTKVVKQTPPSRKNAQPSKLNTLPIPRQPRSLPPDISRASASQEGATPCNESSALTCAASDHRWPNRMRPTFPYVRLGNVVPNRMRPTFPYVCLGNVVLNPMRPTFPYVRKRDAEPYA
jgi:hypothetical protein